MDTWRIVPLIIIIMFRNTLIEISRLERYLNNFWSPIYVSMNENCRRINVQFLKIRLRGSWSLMIWQHCNEISRFWSRIFLIFVYISFEITFLMLFWQHIHNFFLKTNQMNEKVCWSDNTVLRYLDLIWFYITFQYWTGNFA